MGTRTMQDWTPAEHAIYKAMLEVEKMPADEKLTEAVNLLSKAKEAVESFINKGSSKNSDTITG